MSRSFCLDSARECRVLLGAVRLQDKRPWYVLWKAQGVYKFKILKFDIWKYRWPLTSISTTHCRTFSLMESNTKLLDLSVVHLALLCLWGFYKFCSVICTWPLKFTKMTVLLISTWSVFLMRGPLKFNFPKYHFSQITEPHKGHSFSD